MNTRARWFAGLVAGSLMGTGCGHTVTRPSVHGPGSGVVLQTDMGPVDLIAFRDDAQGFRHLGVHAVLADGRHVVRDIIVRGRSEDGMDTFTAEVTAAGVTTYRSLRRVDEDVPNHIEARVESGSDVLHVQMEPVPGGIHLLVERRGAGLLPRRVDRFLDADRLRDPAYAAGIRSGLAALYPSGPLLDHPDKQLLEAVLGSPDWDTLLERRDDGAELEPAGSGGDRRIQRVCAVASVVSLVSCKAASFLPVAWLACVPSAGISIACLAYSLAQAFGNDGEGACPGACGDSEQPLGPPPPPPPPDDAP